MTDILYKEIIMGLHSSCSLATTLAALDAAGIAIVQRDEGWFIEFAEQAIGPYTTPEQALEVSMRRLNGSHWERTNQANVAITR